MAETFCGKSCGTCTDRVNLNCPGCKFGPGRQFSGDCELAQCCTSKGHESCQTCAYSGTCGKLLGKDHIPESRIRKIQEEQKQKKILSEQAPVLGKWLWVLFWLFIPSNFASIMTNDTVVKWAPSLLFPGQILSAVSTILYGFILIRLRSENRHYLTSGICILVTSAVTASLAFIAPGPQAPEWTLLFTIPCLVVSLVGEYNEYMAHSAVLSGVDHVMSEKWNTLWAWFVAGNVGMCVSIVLILILPVFALLVAIAALICGLVVGILKLVYLYRTAKLFREYQD